MQSCDLAKRTGQRRVSGPPFMLPFAPNKLPRVVFNTLGLCPTHPRTCSVPDSFHQEIMSAAAMFVLPISRLCVRPAPQGSNPRESGGRIPLQTMPGIA